MASDVLRTAIAPSFQELAKLAAVATIRTALNFFLAREIKEERSQVAERSEAPRATTPVGTAGAQDAVAARESVAGRDGVTGA